MKKNYFFSNKLKLSYKFYKFTKNEKKKDFKILSSRWPKILIQCSLSLKI